MKLSARKALESTMLKQVKLIFYGRVQGIGFRYIAQRFARKLNLQGYVKNLADGSVKLIAQGDEESINNLVLEIKKYFLSEIEKVETIWQKPTSTFRDFQIQF